MTDFTLTSNQILLKTINDQKGTYLAESDVEFLNLKVTSGTYNTEVTCNALDSGDYRDSATIQYNRVNLSQTFSNPIIFMTLGNIKTSSDLIARINTQYSRNLTDDDILVENVTVTAVSETIGAYTLTVNTGSLIYLGSLTVYFGSPADIADWLRNPVLEYNSDGNSFTLSGGHYRTATAVKPGAQVNIIPDNNSLGVQLDNTGTLSVFTSYPVTNKTIARLQNQQLVEIVGPSGETSYDSDGGLLDTLPVLPPDFDTLMEEFSFTGTEQAGHMTFSTDFSVDKYWIPSGQVYYVDSVNGAITNAGTADAPLKTLDGALSKTPTAGYIVLVTGGTYTLSVSLSGRTIGIICEDTAGATITGAYQDLVWTKTSNAGVWSTPIPGSFAGILDYQVVDKNQAATRFTQVTGISTLLGNNAVYYTDTTNLYIITANGREPDDSIRVVTSGSGVTIKGTGSLYLKNINIVDTDEGFAADATAVDAYPTCYLNNVQVTNTFKNALINSYGAVIYSQNCSGSFGYAGGTYYGPDRQTIAVGATSQFLEVNSRFNTFTAAGIGKCFGSSAVNGAVGIRFKCNYSNTNGITVNDYGAGTITANFNVYAAANTYADMKGGALFCSGSTLANYTGRSVQMILSSVSSNSTYFTFITQGIGESHLYNTLVGTVGQYGLPNPYRFIYTSLGN